MLTIERLKEMTPGVFVCGEIIDSPLGCNMMGSGEMLKWVAVRGRIHDWCIYVGRAGSSFEDIAREGDKVYDKNNIRKLVKCNDEAFKMYRY